jgi:hypothetical protein
MPKRKREDIEGPRSDSRTSGSQERATKKIHYGKTVIHRALKLAKGFERQKLSRRQKTAKKGTAEELKRIEDEIEALKVHEPCAIYTLSLTINRTSI